MHEMTLAIQAVRTVLEFAKENGIAKIDTVVLEIGELSLVVPQYMQDVYGVVCEKTLLEGSKLQIDIVPGNGICRDCGTVYNIVAEKGVCPKCGSREKDILSGQEFDIKEILVPEDE